MAGPRLRGVSAPLVVAIAAGGVILYTLVRNAARARDAAGINPNPVEGAVCNRLGWVWKSREGRLVCTPRHWWWVL